MSAKPDLAHPSRRVVLQGGLGAVAALVLPAIGLAEPSLVGRLAPEFTRQALDGRTLRLHDLRGQVVLVNFWATWCEPCLQEMPVFSGWLKTLAPRGFDVLGVSMDDDPAPLRTVITRLRISYPVVRGDAALALRFGGVLGLPVSFLIDRKGVVRRRIDGAPNLGALHGAIVSLLDTKTEPKTVPVWDSAQVPGLLCR